MNCRYVMVLLLCLGLSGCAQPNSIEETPASQTVESVNNEDITNDSTNEEKRPEGMTVDEDAEFEVEEDSGYKFD